MAAAVVFFSPKAHPFPERHSMPEPGAPEGIEVGFARLFGFGIHRVDIIGAWKAMENHVHISKSRLRDAE